MPRFFQGEDIGLQHLDLLLLFFDGYELTAQPPRVPHLLQRAQLSEGGAAAWYVAEIGTEGVAARRCSGDSVVRGGVLS